MKVFLTNKSKLFPCYLDELCTRPIIAYTRSQLHEKRSVIEISTRTRFEDIKPDVLSGYHIFPENIMAYLTQWHYEKREMQIGDTIVQQVYIPPIPQFSQKIIFGVRIKELISEKNRKGFSYETVEGHVEKGLSIFTFEKLSDKIIFSIETFSRPATFLTKAVAPVFSIPYQAYCTRQALRNVKRLVEMQNC